MNPELKALLDKYAAAGASDDELRQVASAWQAKNGGGAPAPVAPAQAAAAPQPQQEGMLKGFGRAALQHGLMGFGDELGLVDQSKQDSFAKNHPVMDFLATIGGGAAAPLLATAAAPELATVGGAAALGGVAGLLSGAGEGKDLDSRAKGAAIGGITGVAGGAAGAKLSGLLGKAGGAVLDRINPTRSVAREAASLISPETQATMNKINGLAPGGSSIATATRPTEGLKTTSRFTGMVRNLGASGTAAAEAESDLTGQKAALTKGMQSIGEQMNALDSDVPVTPKLRRAISKVRDVIGSHTPELPDADFRLVTKGTPDEVMETAQSPNPSLREAVGDFWKRQTEAWRRNPGTETVEQKMARTALDRHGAENIVSPSLTGSPTVVPGQPPQKVPETVNLQVLRDALGRLRYLSRQAGKRGTEANGPTQYEINEARDAIQSVIYQHEPQFKTLDRHYKSLADEMRVTDKLLPSVQRSRSNYAGNRAAGQEASSLGGSITKAPSIADLVNKLFVNKTAAPRDIAKFITKPGGADAVGQLLKHLPATHPAAAVLRGGIQASTPIALRGLFDKEDEDQQ